LRVDGEIVARETLPGLARVGRTWAPLRELVARWDADVVAAGLTGWDGAAELGVPMVVSNDAVTAHLGALAGEPGAVIVAGTGAIALAAGPHDWARADGWGSLLGDDGGGFWIGRRALATALREYDGRGAVVGGGLAAPHRDDAAPRCDDAAPRRDDAAPRCDDAAPRCDDAAPRCDDAARRRGDAARLRAAAEARFGPLGAIARAVYDAPDPVATVAAFARDVVDLARAGDPAATAILAAAGAELARTVTAALDRAPSCPRRVSWSGGVFAAGELILGPLRAHLDAELVPPRGDGLDGAARLLDRPALFSALIHGP
jgi:N-acetylglucosamine kinase-like BadF-type ATPase